MKTLTFALALLLLSMTACATRSVRDDSPASDLDALVTSVKSNSTVTLLPNGKEYCAELAKSDVDKDECTGDLEDALFNANRKAVRTVKIVEHGASEIKLSRNPCGMFRRMFHKAECTVEPP